ncbi:E3 ubiquitin/ISG15 ligase TRIM25 isoform X3 [Lithobates pipiens]
MAQSLDEMVEELTCSICLSLFSTPVTIPCGHNFCSQCLELCWKENSYTCPQCRYPFPSKPELKKNTLLSNLVSMAQAAQGEVGTADQEQQEVKSDEEPEEEEEERVREETVLCDSCMKNPAAKTCLTCMASFCQDHLLPHLESPAFSDHQLSQPLRDLQQRKCPEHNKLMDHYCWEHSRCICCFCVLNHKKCQTYTLEEGKKKKELFYTELLRSLNQKMEKVTNTSEDVNYEQRKVMENAKKKKELLEGEFEEIKALIEDERVKAMAKIEEEEKKLQSKFNFTKKVLSKKKKEFESMSSKIDNLLQEQDDLQFLKRVTKMTDTVSKEPYKPKIVFDEKLLQQIYNNAKSLKQTVKYKIANPEEAPEWRPPRTPELGPNPEPVEFNKWKPPFTPKPFEDKTKKRQKKSKPTPFGNVPPTAAEPHPPDAKPQRAPRPAAAAVLDSRDQLLKYAEVLFVDARTAHKKIAMQDNFTKMMVSDVPLNYPDDPLRFVSCSQVLGRHGFSSGIHYWEVEKEVGNFSGFGVAYQSIARIGTESRLGRNKVSWCIEWCNGKLQAWHDDKQTDLTTPNTNKYGVLLNIDDGYVAFYCIGKKFSQIYKFNARFTQLVFPAFWMFSSKTVLSLCQSYHL